MKVLRGGCTLPPPKPLMEFIPSCKGPGLVAQPWLGPLGLPSSLSHWVWDHSSACPAMFGLQTPWGKFKTWRKKRKTQEKPEPGPISPSACSASWKPSCQWEAVEKPCQCQDERIHVFPLVWAWVWSQGSEGDQSWDGDAGRDHSRDTGKGGARDEGKHRVGSRCCSCDPSQGHTLCTLTAQPLPSEVDPAPLSDGGSLEGWTSFAQRWTFPWKGK